MAKNYCVTARNERKKILSITIIIFILITLLVLWISNYLRQQSEAFLPPSFDKNAQPIDASVELAETYGILDVTEGYRVGICGKPKLKNECLTICFSNLITNTVWIKLCIVDKEGMVLAETGLIHPGEYIKQVKVNRTIDEGEPIIMQILGYQAETYYSAGEVSLETTIGL